jgi:antitoxin HicB
MSYRYPVVLSREASSKAVTVTFPDFPEAVTFGESEEAALIAAIDCLDEVLASRIRSKEPIPRPSKVRKVSVSPSLGMTAKTALYEAFESSNLPRSRFARKLDVNETEIRRMFDPKHPTKIPRIERALLLLGKRITLNVEDV